MENYARVVWGWKVIRIYFNTHCNNEIVCNNEKLNDKKKEEKKWKGRTSALSSANALHWMKQQKCQTFTF